MPSHAVPASSSSWSSSSPTSPTALLAGCWKLEARRALSLRPRQPGVLEIAQGRAWVTLTGAAQALPADHVLHAGDRLSLRPGQHAVVEAWGPHGAADAAGVLAFRWDCTLPVAGSVASDSARAEGAAAVVVCWDRAVAQPLRDLRLALGQGGVLWWARRPMPRGRSAGWCWVWRGLQPTGWQGLGHAGWPESVKKFQ